MFARQARHRYAGFAGLLRQTQLEVGWIVRSALTAAGLYCCVHDGSPQIVAGATLALSACYVQTVGSRRLLRIVQVQQQTVAALARIGERFGERTRRQQALHGELVVRGGPVWLDTNLTSLSGALRM